MSTSGVREYQVRGNHALANGKVGIHLGPDSNGDENGEFDCQDESKGESATDGTAGTENTWQENVGATADPAGICSAPAGNDEPTGDGKGHGKKRHHKQSKKHHNKHHKERSKHRPDPCVCSNQSWWF